MSFDAEWLALRRAADGRARNAALLRQLCQALAARRSGPLRVLDLGSGTGANLDALAPALGGTQHWTLADNDPVLLARAAAPAGVTLSRCRIDLAGDLAPLFEPAPDLVTASAFFDLCGGTIADDLAALTAQAGAVFYTVLSYDGREAWQPAHPLDADALAAFHADQRRNKGLGPALGPEAVDRLEGVFGARGYSVATAASDWLLEQPRDAALIEALAEGSARAIAPALGGAAQDWLAARRTARHVLIGHRDLLAIPPGR